MKVFDLGIDSCSGFSSSQALVKVQFIPASWKKSAFIYGLIRFPFIFSRNSKMGNKIITEADRQRTPAPKPLPGMSLPTGGRGQRVSLERGVATRSKKNPGKRSKKGG
jgi:hypothetical protein